VVGFRTTVPTGRLSFDYVIKPGYDPSGITARTTKGARKRENALYLVYKIVTRLSHHWRGLNGGPTLMQMVAAGAVFKDGLLVERGQSEAVRIA